MRAVGTGVGERGALVSHSPPVATVGQIECPYLGSRAPPHLLGRAAPHRPPAQLSYQSYIIISYNIQLSAHSLAADSALISYLDARNGNFRSCRARLNRRWATKIWKDYERPRALCISAADYSADNVWWRRGPGSTEHYQEPGPMCEPPPPHP